MDEVCAVVEAAFDGFEDYDEVEGQMDGGSDNESNEEGAEEGGGSKGSISEQRWKPILLVLWFVGVWPWGTRRGHWRTEQRAAGRVGSESVVAGVGCTRLGGWAVTGAL